MKAIYIFIAGDSRPITVLLIFYGPIVPEINYFILFYTAINVSVNDFT